MTVKTLVTYLVAGVAILVLLVAILLLGGYILMLSWNGSVGAVPSVFDISWEQGTWFIVLVFQLQNLLVIQKSVRGTKKD